MDMRQAFMLFLCAHAFGFYYFSSFREGKKFWRLIPEFLIYTIALALVFAPVLDGNNYLYALSILILHLLLSVIYFFTAGRSGNEKVRDTVFVIFEILKIAAFAALAFLHSVRWGSFEPWRQVRFFLDRFALDYNQVLSFAFTLVLIIRPANVIIRKLLSLIEEGQNENRKAAVRIFHFLRFMAFFRHFLLRKMCSFLPCHKEKGRLRNEALHRQRAQCFMRHTGLSCFSILLLMKKGCRTTWWDAAAGTDD